MVMNGGIAKVGCDGIPSVLRLNAFEVLRHLIKSLVPSDLLPTMSGAAHGIFQPVLIIVNILQSNCLRANVPASEWIVLVTADFQTLAGFNGGFDAASTFAKLECALLSW